MAKKQSDAPYRVSAAELIEESKNRDILHCTPSSDLALGGGIPLGATVLIGAPPKVGKTTLMAQYAASAQNEYGSKVFFFPTEGRLTGNTLSQVRGLKTDIDHFEIIRPPQITDESGKVIGFRKWPAQKWWEEIGKTIENHPRSVIIVDSISSLSTEREVSEGMGYQGRGELQRLEAQFCRKYADLIIANQICLVLIAQIQANTSGYGASTTIKAGYAVRHQADIILQGKTVNKWNPNSKTGRIEGHDMVFNVIHSCLGPPHVEMTTPLRYGYGIDDIKDILNQAVNFGMITTAGSYYYLPFETEEDKDINIELEKEKRITLQGEIKLRNWFIVNKDKLKLLEQKIRTEIIGT